MIRFKPRTPKWRKHATAEENSIVDGCDRNIKTHKDAMAEARRIKANTINAVNKRAQAHAGREGR